MLRDWPLLFVTSAVIPRVTEVTPHNPSISKLGTEPHPECQEDIMMITGKRIATVAPMMLIISGWLLRRPAAEGMNGGSGKPSTMSFSLSVVPSTGCNRLERIPHWKPGALGLPL